MKNKNKPLPWTILVLFLLILPVNSIQVGRQQQQQPRKTTHNVQKGRRALIGLLVTTATTTTTTLLLPPPQQAQAIYNPLNLKGTFWETGEIYVKKKDEYLPSDPDDLLPSIIETINALDQLSDQILDGKFDGKQKTNFDDLSRQLRGGLISESKLRIRGYALIDQLPEGDKNTYLAEQAFRLFLIRFANLDATVEAAARQAKIDGGLVETLGLAVVSPFGAVNEVAKINAEPSIMRGDSRIEVLASLGETCKALKAFTTAAENSLKNEKE